MIEILVSILLIMVIIIIGHRYWKLFMPIVVVLGIVGSGLLAGFISYAFFAMQNYDTPGSVQLGLAGGIFTAVIAWVIWDELIKERLASAK